MNADEMITMYNGNSDTVLQVPCPNCKEKADVSVGRFVMAINRQDKWTCKDCGYAFLIKFETMVLETCNEERHMYYIHFLDYKFCPYCGKRIHSVPLP